MKAYLECDDSRPAFVCAICNPGSLFQISRYQGVAQGIEEGRVQAWLSDLHQIVQSPDTCITQFFLILLYFWKISPARELGL